VGAASWLSEIFEENPGPTRKGIYIAIQVSARPCVFPIETQYSHYVCYANCRHVGDHRDTRFVLVVERLWLHAYSLRHFSASILLQVRDV
jgi:hypothetical protein